MNKKPVLPYRENGSKKEQVKRMFDNVAWRYDFLNRFMSMGIDRLWRKKLIRQMLRENPLRVLDMATGTGDLAIMTAKKASGVIITGVDLSENMIRIGQKKIKSENLNERIKLYTGDAENLEFESAHFDAAMIAFGVRNFENLDKGLAELQRVLKPGAFLYVLEFSKPTIFPIKQLFNLYFKFAVPFLGRLFSRDHRAYSYLYESVQAFPDYNRFTDKLIAAGFSNCKWEALSFGICCLYTGEKLS